MEKYKGLDNRLYPCKALAEQGLLACAYCKKLKTCKFIRKEVKP